MSQAIPFMSPSGWFQIGWSHEWGAGEVKPLRYFGRDLVAYRGEGGLHAFDAHCLHQGAHLGCGGTVSGNDIVCPFHGWRWDPAGRNVDIPFHDRVNQSARLIRWPVSERSGVVFMWHGPLGEDPYWDPPALPSEEGHFPMHPEGAMVWSSRRLTPQFVLENQCDPIHFHFVHGAAHPTDIAGFSAEGHTFRAVHSIVLGGDKKSTWLTPQGPVVGQLDVTAYGVGLLVGRFVGADDTVQLIATTPVDDATATLWASTWVPQRLPGGQEMSREAYIRRVDEQRRQIEQDLRIWENMSYVSRPLYTRREASAGAAIRRWSQQFYPKPAQGSAEREDGFGYDQPGEAEKRPSIPASERPGVV